MVIWVGRSTSSLVIADRPVPCFGAIVELRLVFLLFSPKIRLLLQMQTLIHKRVELARDGFNPYVICRLRSGWAVLGDSQFIPGYSLLLPDPVVPSLNALSKEERTQFLLDT